jgi:hypothetical protein
VEKASPHPPSAVNRSKQKAPFLRKRGFLFVFVFLLCIGARLHRLRKSAASSEIVPQRLKPNSLQTITYGLKAVPFRNSLLDRLDFRRTVPAPDFLAAASISPGERVFKPAKTLYFPTNRATSPQRALALVGTSPSFQSAPALISRPRSHVLYQGTASAVPYKTPAMRALAPATVSLARGTGPKRDV